MSCVFVSDLRTLVEYCNTYAGGHVAEVAQRMEKIIGQMENRHETAIDHRDLWEYGTEGVHPARARMTIAAREYKQAERELRDALQEAEKTGNQPVGKYDRKAYHVDRNPWHEDTIMPSEYDSMVVIIENLTNREELDKALEYWGSGTAHDNQHRSVTYFLHKLPVPDTFLVMHTGGGWMLLKDDIVLTDTSPWWKMIETGEVPADWLRK